MMIVDLFVVVCRADEFFCTGLFTNVECLNLGDPSYVQSACRWVVVVTALVAASLIGSISGDFVVLLAASSDPR